MDISDIAIEIEHFLGLNPSESELEDPEKNIWWDQRDDFLLIRPSLFINILKQSLQNPSSTQKLINKIKNKNEI